MDSSTSKKPRVIELFSGAGLFGLAFKKAGFRLTHAVEIDSVAASTYAKNLGEHILVGDVSRVTAKGECEVLIAGPPCQGFSTLGSRNPNDPRNQLALETVRWAKKTRPKCVVIENVAAFLDTPTWKQLARMYEELGFSVTSFVLDAADYGVAQNRRRSFTIASTIGLPPKPKSYKQRESVREAWTDLPNTPNGINHHYAPVPSALAKARMNNIPPGGDRRDLMRNAPHLCINSWWKLGNASVTDSWGRMKWDSPSNTLRTCLQNASKGRYIHPEQNRVISLREAARLQSIPDSWQFEGLPTQVARQIGNSVPPKLGNAIATSLRSLF